MHNCEGVRISDCFIRTFDDSICVKGFDCYYEGDVAAAVRAAMYRNGMSYDRFCDTVIERCTIWNDWGKSLEIGAETKAEEIFDITFRNCDVIHVTGKVLDCMNVDYADVHDVLYENIRIEADEVIPVPRGQKYEDDVYDDSYKDYMPSIFTSSVEFHHEYSEGGQRRGINRHFTLRNVHVTGDKPLIFHLRGYDADHATHHIAIEGLYHNGERIADPARIAARKNEFTHDVTLEGKAL
jgi:hypothetical protein